MPDVRVGIVSWNTAALLDACLDALPAALDGVDAEIVVVDNASADDSVAVAAAHAGVTVIKNAANVGYARAMNQALAGGSAPVLIALNPDTVPPPRSLAELVRRLEARPDVGVASTRLVGVDGREQHSCYRFPSISVSLVVSLVPRWLQRAGIGRRWWLEGSADHRQRTDVDWAIGAVHAIRREALGGAAPYSERWFMYVEDVELCWRLRQAGYRTRLEGDIDVVHVGNAAGAQAWAATRATRYWIATYDFVATTRGSVYARLYAGLNAALVAVLGVVYRAGARLPGDRAMRRQVAAELWGTFRAHARCAWRGAPPGGLAPDGAAVT